METEATAYSALRNIMLAKPEEREEVTSHTINSIIRERVCLKCTHEHWEHPCSVIIAYWTNELHNLAEHWGVWKLCAKTNAEVGLKIYTHWILINNEKLL